MVSRAHNNTQDTNKIITTSTGTVHTSAKARFISVAISVFPSGESVRDRHKNVITTATVWRTTMNKWQIYVR